MKNLIRCSRTALVLLALASCSQAEVEENKTVEFSYVGVESQRNKAKEAMKALPKICPALFTTHSRDIESIEVDYEKIRTGSVGLNKGEWAEHNKEKGLSGKVGYDDGCYHYLCAEYDWHEAIEVVVKIKDYPETLRGDLIRANGNNLFYRFGGHDQAGMVSRKFPKFCGRQKRPDGKDNRWRVPSLDGVFDAYQEPLILVKP